MGESWVCASHTGSDGGSQVWLNTWVRTSWQKTSLVSIPRENGLYTIWIISCLTDHKLVISGAFWRAQTMAQHCSNQSALAQWFLTCLIRLRRPALKHSIKQILLGSAVHFLIGPLEHPGVYPVGYFFFLASPIYGPAWDTPRPPVILLRRLRKFWLPMHSCQTCLLFGGWMDSPWQAVLKVVFMPVTCCLPNLAVVWKRGWMLKSSAWLGWKEVAFLSPVWWGVTQTVYMEACGDDAITQLGQTTSCTFGFRGLGCGDWQYSQE